MVRIRDVSDCEGVGVGSGFLISGQRIVTARHVVAGTREQTVERWDGSTLNANVVGQASLVDLAVLHASSAPDAPLTLAASNPPVNAIVRAIGFPEGKEMKITSGRVLGYVTNAQLGTLGNIMRISTPIKPGNSGGPLINAKGQVVGVVYAIETATKDGLAIPVATLHELLDDPRGLQPIQPCTGFFSNP
jgi:S1-C subfamily serine protease